MTPEAIGDMLRAAFPSSKVHLLPLDNGPSMCVSVNAREECGVAVSGPASGWLEFELDPDEHGGARVVARMYLPGDPQDEKDVAIGDAMHARAWISMMRGRLLAEGTIMSRANILAQVEQRLHPVLVDQIRDGAVFRNLLGGKQDARVLWHHNLAWAALGLREMSPVWTPAALARWLKVTSFIIAYGGK